MELTEIQKFYKDKTIFITGGTGLLGKVLVEKLLRACPNLNKIIVTIRPTKNQSIEERISAYFENRLFDLIKNNNSEVLKKVLFFTSNLEQKNCGITGEEYDFVRMSTNVIFHCAATVEFKASLKTAVNCNIRVTKNIIDMAKEMENLQALIYISTLWSHSIIDDIEEKVLNLSYEPESLYSLVDNIDEKLLKEITPTLLDKWPNTYVMTKHIGENLIEAEKENLPVVIFRAPGTGAIYRDPVPGWLIAQTITMLGIYLSLGKIKVVYSDKDSEVNLLPVDLVINCMIAVAWRTAIRTRDNELEVYNYTIGPNTTLRKDFYNSFVNTKFPLEGIVLKPGYVATESKWLFDIYFLIYCTIPAYIYDTFLKLSNRKPEYVNTQKRYKQMLEIIAFFLTYNFKFEYKNVPALWNKLHTEDKKIFNFAPESINWAEYYDIYNKGIKELLKEDFNNMEKCEARRYLLRAKF